MDDLFSKMQGEQNILEKLASKIPGFGGYLKEEQRRTADKILRDTLANRYEEQWQRVSGIQRRMVEEAMIDHVDNMESAAVKLRTFIDGMKTTAYGYGSLFDAVKVNDAELQKLYAYDYTLLEGVSKVAQAVDHVESSLGTDGLPAAIRNLTTVTAECVTMFDRRKEVLTSK
ncbi:MAG TPA: hypothetical protein VJ020_10185 [Anaerolineales bacterium]|nr:hypothetical protein [Anaerolineales bacterium]